MSDGIEIERSKHAQQFVVIGNAEARDRRLSFRARGLHHHLLSLPPGWRVTTTQLAQDNPEGRDAIRTALNELISLRYVTKRKHQDERGRWHTIMTVHDKPEPETETGSEEPVPDTEDGFPGVGAPGVGKPGAIQKTVNENSKKDGQRLASRRGRASGAAAARWTDEKIIKDIRNTIVAVYGKEESDWTSDEQILALWEWKKPQSGKFTSPGAYMGRIFADCVSIDTLLANLPCDDEDDESWACPRCCEHNPGPDPESGVCEVCTAALRGFYATTKPSNSHDPAGWNAAILAAVKKSLFVAAGRSVDDVWAARVADYLITGRNVEHPVQYVIDAIERDPHPERFLPTPAPPRAA